MKRTCSSVTTMWHSPLGTLIKSEYFKSENFWSKLNKLIQKFILYSLHFKVREVIQFRITHIEWEIMLMFVKCQDFLLWEWVHWPKKCSFNMFWWGRPFHISFEHNLYNKYEVHYVGIHYNPYVTNTGTSRISVYRQV